MRTPVDTAVEVVEWARDGRFAEIAALFAPPLRAVLTAGALQAAWLAETAGIGPVTEVGEPSHEPLRPDLIRVSIPVTCERGQFTAVMSVDPAGLLNGLRLAPPASDPWAPPPYADPDAFEEHDVTVGSGALAVPGTVTVPRGNGPWPAVVLLSGGGPFDRDATIGPNKPLKDLAWGLAGRGVAVLRHDKVTFTHAAQVAAADDFTMTREYVPHAVAAVRLLQNEPGVDSDRVFVAGHSMGGKVAPRVAETEPSIAGAVILAGDAEPMHQAAVRVARHLAALDPGPHSDAAVAQLLRQAATVETALSPSTPREELPFGLPASYWLDLRSYDPVATAAALDKPLLILQGGRDYQVTVEHDLPLWRAGLTARQNVTIQIHEADDHLFFPGTAPSTPAGYLAAQHVDAAVVRNVAAWLGGAASL
ncbi:alpha/beta hydrolase [Streptomyces beihaiensis]|uniref:Dienelactone hydrolase family protein n=1 Tax=Streptomyces beihaiensis TaxID=2984495 RepID=A0ABT3TWG0_9ACTN|nr:dienelactone hydrolase family protein [Streptomyces beihaiensis]MCX3060826.1 dienelactone hydrolase family protein [Streptomyces beihaiensis]